MDYYFFQLINNLAGRWRFLDLFGIFCAKYLIFAMFFAAACFLVVRGGGRRQKIGRALAIIFSVAFGYILKLIIQFFYSRPRPFASYDVLQLINKSADASFPSGHAVLVFALAFATYFYNKKIGAAFLAAALLVGVGRIFVGVHYPLDIFGGVLVGFLSAYAVEKFSRGKSFKIF